MVEILKQEEQSNLNTSNEEIQHDTISALFEERDQQSYSARNNVGVQKAEQKTEIIAHNADIPEAQDTEEQQLSDDELPEVEALKEELAKTKRRIEENQRYSRQNSRKLKEALKITRDLVENGALSEEEATRLVDSLETANEEDGEPHIQSTDPLSQVFAIANNELVNLQKYSDDQLLEDKVRAFDYFLSVTPPEEVNEVIEDLIHLKDDPIKLTKTMLAIGQHYYEDSYKDIQSAGGIYKYISQQKNNIDELNKTIDKLNKKPSQYEEFDKPRYRINESSDFSNGEVPKDILSDLFEERDRVKRR